MITVAKIKDLKSHYITTLYNKVRTAQIEDEKYRDDTFEVPEIRDPHRLLRSGIGARMVDSPAEQIITSNPQVIVHTKNKEVALRLSKEINEHWIPILKRQNPNPFKEYVKNLLLRGESFIKLAHNELWVTGKKERDGLPVKFIIPDPMVVYASPQEDDNGIPKQVIVFYQRQMLDTIENYPFWANSKKKEEKYGEMLEWMEYYDSGSRYYGADEEGVLKGGVQQNIYGFTPFIRKYSGFGRRSFDGDLSKLIVSDIRMSRDLIKEECAIRSDIASILHLFAHKPLIIIAPQGTDPAAVKNMLEAEFDVGSYSINVLPFGTEIDKRDIFLPSAEMFNHLYQIRAEIDKRNPFVMAGFPFGSSGRQQDISFTQGMARYNTVIENTQIAWGTAFEKAIKICNKVPTLKPDGLRKEDLEAEFICEVNLKAADPVEADRLATLGDRMWNKGQGSIDLRTNLIKYQGYSPEDAEEIIVNMMVDRITLYNPDVSAMMGMMFAEEAGMEKYLEAAKMQTQKMVGQQGAMMETAPPTTEERILGEAQTLEGLDLANRGARNPPSRFTR